MKEKERDRLRRIFAKAMIRWFKGGRRLDTFYPKTHAYLIKRINWENNHL